MKNMIGLSESTFELTNGFKMRPVRMSDFKALVRLWSDPEVTRFLPGRVQPTPEEETKKKLTYLVSHWEKRGYGIWAIAMGAASELSGYCGLRFLEEIGEVEVLYGLAKTHWGNGIVTQAAREAVSFGFNVSNLDKVIALVLDENKASKRVIEKIGFHYEKQVHIFDTDLLYYSLKKEKSS